MPATAEFVPLARLAAARLAWLAEFAGPEADALVAAVAGACDGLVAKAPARVEVRYLLDDGGVEVRGQTGDGQRPFRVYQRRGTG